MTAGQAAGKHLTAPAGLFLRGKVVELCSSFLIYKYILFPFVDDEYFFVE